MKLTLKIKTILIMGLLVIPTLLTTFFYNFTDSKSKKLSIYVEREFFLSGWARTVNSYINVYILGHNQIGPIHLGYNNWLFVNYTNEESFHQVIGKINMKGLHSWENYISKNCPNPYDQDIPYVFGLIPNKETLYPERTSYKLRKYFFSEKSVFDRITSQALQKCSQRFVDIKLALSNYKLYNPSMNLYHATDSHWNTLGAMVAYNALAMPINKKIMTLNFNKNDKSQGLDSWLLVEPSAPFLRNYYQEKNLVTINRSNYKNPCLAFNPNEEEYAEYHNEVEQGIILLIGDSFRSEIAKYFACTSRTTIVLKRSAAKSFYKQVVQKYGKPDYVVELFIQKYMDFAY